MKDTPSSVTSLAPLTTSTSSEDVNNRKDNDDLITNGHSDNFGDLLVTEFPPPPNYFNTQDMIPPIIPTTEISRSVEKLSTLVDTSREESEMNRLDFVCGMTMEGDKIDGTENEMDESKKSIKRQDFIKNVCVDVAPDLNDIAVSVRNLETGRIPAVFGEIVEVNGECDEPKIIRDEVSRLNKIVLEGFVKLLGELVDNPSENKKFRDDLSFNLFLMLQECNKFREHQGRETMIETLEKQLEEKQKSLNLVRGEILNANEVLKDLSMSV